MMREMSLDVFGEQFPVFAATPRAEDIKLAKDLAEDAARHAGEALKQRAYAETARGSVKAAPENLCELARIAVWHYERSAEAFRRSVVGFESAAKIERGEKTRRNLSKRAAAMIEAARRAERAARELKTTGNNKKGGSNDETG
ncbi:MAG TPA: hypothetical protein VIL74_17670 [Pyrinomonadaceae bacterium]